MPASSLLRFVPGRVGPQFGPVPIARPDFGRGHPNDGNVSRLVESLGRQPHLNELPQVFNVLAQRLGIAVPDLGQHLVGDSTALYARAKKKPKTMAQDVQQGLPQPSGGRKE